MAQRFVILSVLLLSALTLFLEPVGAETMYVRHPGAKLYSDKSSLSSVVRNLKAGTEIEVLKRESRFVHVRTKDDAEGWVYIRFLASEKPEEEESVFSSMGRAFRSQDPSATAASAAARGVEEEGANTSETQSSRKTTSLEAIEKYRPTGEQVDRFLREGALGEYAR